MNSINHNNTRRHAYIPEGVVSRAEKRGDGDYYMVQFKDMEGIFEVPAGIGLREGYRIKKNPKSNGVIKMDVYNHKGRYCGTMMDNSHSLPEHNSKRHGISLETLAPICCSF